MSAPNYTWPEVNLEGFLGIGSEIVSAIERWPLYGVSAIERCPLYGVSAIERCPLHGVSAIERLYFCVYLTDFFLTKF